MPEYTLEELVAVMQEEDHIECSRCAWQRSCRGDRSVCACYRRAVRRVMHWDD